jgi:OMF family outer membrane factor
MLVSVNKQHFLILILLVFGQGLKAQIWTLQQCIDTARVQNKTIRIANNNAIMSGEKTRESKAYLFPRLTANGEYKYYFNLPYQLLPQSTFNPSAPESQFNAAQFGVPHNINANIQLFIPLYNPQISGRIEASKIGEEITALQGEKTEEQIYFETSNLYYNAQILKAQIVFIENNIINANQLLGNLKLLKKHLLATGTDEGKVALQLAQLSNQKTATQNKLLQVLNNLKFIIGLPANQNMDVENEINTPNPITYNNSPYIDSKLLFAQNKLLKTELKTLSRSRYLPSVNIIGMYGTTGFGYDKEPNQFLDFYPIGFTGLQISYPLFNGTVTMRKMNQKRLEISNNQLKSDWIQDQNSMRVSNLTLERSNALGSVETTKKQIELAQNIYSKTLLQQKQGTASLTDVLLADNALREAQQTNITAIIDYLKANLELKKITGNLE